MANNGQNILSVISVTTEIDRNQYSQLYLLANEIIPIAAIRNVWSACFMHAVSTPPKPHTDVGTRGIKIIRR